jgi:hypothetical protein
MAKRIRSKLGKNYQLLEHLRLSKWGGEFVMGIAALRRKYDPNPTDTPYTFWYRFSSQGELDRFLDQLEEDKSKLVERWSAKKWKAFKDAIQALLNEHDLGYEWHETIQDWILFRFIMPPDMDLHMSVPKDIGRKAILVEVGPATTLEDFKLAVPYIQKKQRELWPKYKKHNYRPGYEKRLREHADYRALKRENPVLNDTEAMAQLYPDDDPVKIPSKKDDKRRANRLQQLKRRITR